MYNNVERWKDIEGYSGLYRVSNLGNVMSLKFGKEKILKQAENNQYLNVGLSMRGSLKKRSVHQLVAVAFLNHKPCGMSLVVNHKNLNKLDNRAENLEIVTNRENSNRLHIKNTSKHVGVCWHKASKKWCSSINRGGKSIYLGVFKTEVEASNMYKKALNEQL